MPNDRDAWFRNGGSPRVALYEKLGETATFVSEEGRCLAAIHPNQPHQGTVSVWSGSADVLAEAENWLRGRGCTTATGPVEMCTWFPHGAILGPFDDAPFFMEPTDSAERWMTTGYRPKAHFLSAVAEHDAMIRPATDRVAKLAVTGLSVRQLALHPGEGRASEADFRDAIALLHQIRSESYAKVPNFAEISVEAAQEWYAPLRQKTDPRLVILGRAPSGEPAGILFALPDSAQPERGWFVVNTLGVRPKFRQAGLGAWLVAAAHQSAKKAGYKAGVHLMPLEQDHLPVKTGFRVIRRYAVLEKPL